VTFSEQVEVTHHRVSDSEGRTPLNTFLMLIGCLGFSGAFNTDTHSMSSFSGQRGQAGTRKVKPIWILMKEEITGWQWHQLDHLHIICTMRQIDNQCTFSIIMAALCNRGAIIFLPCSFFLLSFYLLFFLRLISAAAGWMSTIL